MGRRLLVILAVLGVLVGAAGLVQARGGHGGHHGHGRRGGPHHGEHGPVVPGPGVHGGMLVPPSGGLVPAPPLGSGPPAGYTSCDDPVGVYPQILRCAHPWRRTPPLTTQ
jgi:hypothetical protein